ncbi:DUF6043 family protein [Alistipes sp. i18-0019-D1]|jgi:hypothetical protein|uniref:DUF6043 family protein n=1 Tax=Alistipes sp. i18-0019-D1 TaxID=3132707 RepID=UPI0036F3568E
MEMKAKYERFEDFKADIWKWKTDNREKYNRFAQMMSGCDERGFFLFYRAVAKQMPQLVKQWELTYNDDTCPDKFAEIYMLFKEQNLPQEIVGQYGRERSTAYTATPSLWQRIRMFFGWRSEPRIRVSAPLVLSWLFFGRSFETMVLMLEKQAKRPKAGMLDIQTCGYVSKLVVQTSIKGHYRSCKDWERFFAEQNAVRSGKLGEWAFKEVKDTGGVNTQSEQPIPQFDNDTPATGGRPKAKDLPLSSYINGENKDAVIGVLRKFLISQHTANGQALSYYALQQLELLTVTSDKEFSVGVVKEFGDMPTLKSESAIRQAISQLRREQYITVNQKMRSGRLLDSDEYTPVLRRLKAEIKAVQYSIVLSN